MWHVFTRLFKPRADVWSDTQPIRAELFGVERFREHAVSLANSQLTTKDSIAVQSVVERLKQDAAALADAYKELCATVKDGIPITPAAEWLIDNYHLIEEHVRQATVDLPQGYYRQLPKLAEGPLAGHPRIFGIAWAYAAHTDSRFDGHVLTEFVNAYQDVQPLTIGELWATAISLRLVLIENLTRISQRTIGSSRARLAADEYADKLLEHKIASTGLGNVFPSQVAEHAQLSFAVQLIKRLRDQESVDPTVLAALRNHVHALGFEFDSAVAEGHHRQAAANVTMRNLVTSLRFISDYNWEEWFDRVSTVDKLLSTHPRYAEMDFRTRNNYRSAIEDLSQHSQFDEHTVAAKALESATLAQTSENIAAEDPGYHLLGSGRPVFETGLNYNFSARRKFSDAVRRSGLAGYVSAILLMSAIVLALGVWPLAIAGVPLALLVLLVVSGLAPVFEAAMAMVNYTVTQILRPVILPALALREGVPADLRTLVAVPALLTTIDEVEHLVERLEVHYLANNNGELYFALVTDWADSDSEREPGDDVLVAAALDGIDRLNRQYGDNRFLLLHRSRNWNEQQGKWMGWERKRGKLHELNRLLRNASDTTFMLIGGKLPPFVRFVITLDADTKLPRDAARRLVGKLAHPLNRPFFDEQRGRVTQGYAILQPRVTPTLPVTDNGTTFQRIFSTRRGTDPYVFAVSDVYQDLFGEGSFVGKGIYDIDAFEAALANRIPENAMLSHDLFEGVFARAALVTDIEVVEEFPERYAVAAARQHRWVRGDWQLLPWIAKARGRGAANELRSIPAVGLFKMLDNLRRSLTPLFTVIALIVAWLWLSPSLAVAWTAFILLTSFVPAFVPVFAGSSIHPSPNSLSSQVSSFVNEIIQAVLITVSNLVFLGHQAGMMADAIARTLFRLLVSKKNLLEWTTAAQVQMSTKPNLLGSYALMLASVLFGLLALAIVLWRQDWVSVAATPFSVFWLAAPAIAWWMSKTKLPTDELAASPSDRLALRLVARRTWTFFEAFVVADDNMLPPDNFQEDPKPVVAHRTSPTNIGLYFLSIASAREFGWLGSTEALEKIEATLATVKKMERFRGHLYNWYDTQTLVPLEPRYVSAVDSGNLAGHLLALANMCSSWSVNPLISVDYLEGIGDSAEILSEELNPLSKTANRNQRQMLGHMKKQLEAFRAGIERARNAAELLPVRLIDLAVQASAIYKSVEHFSTTIEPVKAANAVYWATALQQSVESQFRDASLDNNDLLDVRRRLETVASAVRSFALEMEFGFLNDPQRQLMSIGYRASDATLDGSCYDMLASEAALASFLAIAKGDLRARHWFRLARPVTATNGGAALVSWSGSMFEYLMPSLVLQTPQGSLLGQTAKLIVKRQIEYGAQLGTPWGISESAFSARDKDFTYQYSNFGVPGLGLKRGLADNAVIAPYATGLASMVAPRAAAANFTKLRNAGASGRYGFYESIDYTPSRLRDDEKMSVVKAYFAHHQGMTIAAIYNAVSNGNIRTHFHAEPIVRATELLLQERAPQQVPVKLVSVSTPAQADSLGERVAAPSYEVDPRTSLAPSTHLLSNGQYSVMMTASGSGYSAWNGIAVNRWREDPTCDDWGSFIFLSDLSSGKTWTAGYMPSIAQPDSYMAEFSIEKIEIHRTDGMIATTLGCLVSSEDNAEARRVMVVNNSSSARIIEVTTYVELALAAAAADSAHPAFSKLFVTTEYVPELETLLATRRKRSPSDPEIWMAQFMLTEGNRVGQLEFETSRGQFLGQGNELWTADAMAGGSALGGSQGTVLDPIFSLRRRLRIPAGQHASCTIWTVVADSRAEVLDMVDRHRQNAAYERAQILAWSHSRIQLRHLSVDPTDASMFQRLASHLIYAGPTLRAPSHVLQNSMRTQPNLWSQGISGNKPVLLVRIDAVEDLDLVRQLLRAHEYWSAKQLAVDLVILNDRRASYIQDLQGAIEELIRKNVVNPGRVPSGTIGQVFALRADLMPQEALAMLPGVARVNLHARGGTLPAQMSRLRVKGVPQSPLKQPLHIVKTQSEQAPPQQHEDLSFFNGFGGFDERRNEYVVVHDATRPAPAPWINVIANPNFGTHCTAEGPGATWIGNSRECQITPWSNDPVCNRPSEAFYIRDDRSGIITSPCLAPLRNNRGKFRTRHGFGYSIYEAEDADLTMELLQFVPLTDTLKIERLRIATSSPTVRQLTVTFFADLVLGSQRAASAPFVTTEIDGETGALFVRNRWSEDFGERLVFIDMCGVQSAWSGDRQHFMGRYGNLSSPRAVAYGENLSNTAGGGLDPCAALQYKIMVSSASPGEVNVLVGSAANDAEARALITRYRKAEIDVVLSDVKAYWNETLDAVSVKTPDPSFNVMLNGWLLYQTLACRMFGRAGFYQASGAYGFRDQLQDSMSIATVRPDISRQHILRAASRQFPEGDLQHWWLPSTGVGVRTRISDDTVWLAYCVHYYVKTTGDAGILDESVPFIEGRALNEGEHDAYFQPTVSEKTATVYDHCAIALDHSLPAGEHGLPLMGTGDWNDGMNRVGELGKGESVWLGWFLYTTLKAFVPLAAARKDTLRVKAWNKRMESLKQALDTHGWDGEWYRRGYFDDGTPLGSAQSSECRIDAIAQSWAVLSDAANPERAAAALAQSYEKLVKPDDGIALLFTPPFDTSAPDPGYVKAYPPGIRENGGQYTHGVIWSIFAHAKLGQTEKATQLFSMLNPVNHALTQSDALRYRVEPYVVAADVYSVAPHVGRGGWTWYTGAAGWLYRAGIEAILGFTREGNKLRVRPCIPNDWPEFIVRYKFGGTRYEFVITRDGVAEPETKDIKRISGDEYLITLHDVGGDMRVRLAIGVDASDAHAAKKISQASA